MPTEASLPGLADAVAGIEVARIRDSLAALLTNIVGLVMTFIGENLTFRLVRQEWPEAILGEFSLWRREA